MNRNKIVSNQGYVLLAALMFMQIFSSLGLYGLSVSAAMQKNNQHEYWREVASVLAKSRMIEWENAVIDKNITCIKTVTPAYQVVKRSRDWWLENACVDNTDGRFFYYFTELLARDPCVVIEKVENKQIVTANYYRITLASFDAQSQSPTVIIQSVVAVPGDENNLCADKIILIRLGLQSRREL